MGREESFLKKRSGTKMNGCLEERERELQYFIPRHIVRIVLVLVELEMLISFVTTIFLFSTMEQEEKERERDEEEEKARTFFQKMKPKSSESDT